MLRQLTGEPRFDCPIIMLDSTEVQSITTAGKTCSKHTHCSIGFHRSSSPSVIIYLSRDIFGLLVTPPSSETSSVSLRESPRNRFSQRRTHDTLNSGRARPLLRDRAGDVACILWRGYIQLELEQNGGVIASVPPS
jgi:hypothetical protein